MQGVPHMSADPDAIHQKLWARKKLKIRQAKNLEKRARKQYFKAKEEVEGEPQVNDKHSKFYESLFNKSEEPNEQLSEISIKKPKQHSKKQKKDPVEKIRVASEPEKEEAKAPEPTAAPASKDAKKEKRTFNNKLEKLKFEREQALKDKVQRQKDKERNFKQKIRKANLINRKTSKGQMRMSGLISNYLDRI